MPRLLWESLGSPRVANGQWEMEDTWTKAAKRHRGASGQSTCDLSQDEGGANQLSKYKKEEMSLNCTMWDLYPTQADLPGAEKAFLTLGMLMPSRDFKSRRLCLLWTLKSTLSKAKTYLLQRKKIKELADVWVPSALDPMTRFSYWL